MKPFLRHPLVIALIAACVATYGRLVFATCRIRIITPVPQQLTAGPVVLATWHQNFCALPLLHKPNPAPLMGLMSASRDGSLTQAIAKRFGIGAAVGSSNRKAVSGTRQMLRMASGGNSLFLTPDGPRGPIFVAKPGATEIARLTALPLIPCAAYSSRGYTFGSWDAFRFPYPFSTFYLAYGKALQDTTPAALTASLNTLTTQAKAAAGSRHAGPKTLA